MTFLLTLAGFALAIALMATGIMLGRRRLEHGCGRECSCLPATTRRDGTEA